MPLKKTSIIVSELDCAAEQAVLQKSLSALPDVASVEFDVMNRRLTVTHDLEDESVLHKAIRSVRMTPTTGSGWADATSDPTTGGRGIHETTGSIPAWRVRASLAISGALAVASEIVALTLDDETTLPVMVMASASIVVGGLPTIRKGFIALRARTLNINFLMSVAVIGAAAIGEWPEAAVVIFLFALAEHIEAYSLDRARNAVRSLMAMTPDVAAVKQTDGSWSPMPASEVVAGAIVRVRPGERLPLDGVVVAGESSVDQAPITGESVPVDKTVGDSVFAGTINGNGVLEFRTTGGKDESTLARIVRTVQEAQSQRAPTQRFVDAFSRIYTPVLVALAGALAVVPWLVFSQPFMPWLYRALVLLVIACPCALVISTPVTVVSGLAAAARRGILIKGGVYLETGRKLRIIALDKTGTVTQGKPRLVDVLPQNGHGRDQVLQIAASLDALSAHPIAHAVREGWTGPLLSIGQFESITGRGVSGRIDGETYNVGNHRLAEERGVCSPEVESQLSQLEAQGKTAIVVATSRQAIGILAVADTPRETSIAALRELHALGLRTVMLSGDNQRTVEAIAKAVGIDDGRGNLLPEEKLTAIDEFKARYGWVGMVGDGINDAPALAKADIGFAMGAAGTDTALETADVALMRDDLRSVPEFVRLSRRTASVLAQNIAFAIVTKSIFFLLAVLGLATLWMAVLADMGASLIVVANGLRLLRSHPSTQQGTSLAVNEQPRP
ncbi:MAG: cadmium-translocating P-type ATPase [Phycisphaerales bacterium]|nr:cadmium-translocating P-type ATPase [Phycisphaerales bacterium]